MALAFAGAPKLGLIVKYASRQTANIAPQCSPEMLYAYGTN
jgi:hypothetical protein